MRTTLLAASALAALSFAVPPARADTASTTLACDPPVTITVSTAGATVSCATASSPPLAPIAPADPPDDGSATAPLSTPAFPTALNGLHRPSWKVADVDPGYGNGNPLHGKTKDWQAPGVLPACATTSTQTYQPTPAPGSPAGAPLPAPISYNQIRVGDAPGGGLDGKPGCSFVGIDFTTHGGVSFYVNGGSHPWFDEDDFAAIPGSVPSGNDIINCSACASVSITRYDFNGEAPIGPWPTNGGAGLLDFGGVGSGPFGPLILEHGKSYMVAQHVVDGGAGRNQTLTGARIRFNTVYQTGTASQCAANCWAHGEFVYLACGAMSDVREVFNTIIEDGTGPLPLSNTAGLALVADAACGSASTTSSELGDNVVLMLGRGGGASQNSDAPAGSRAFFLGGGTGPSAGTFTGNAIHDNYFVFSGAYYPADQVPPGNTVSGNLNMKTGKVCDLTRPNVEQC